VLDKVKRQLNTASRTIEETGVRTRARERRLRSVEELPEEEASTMLELPSPAELYEIEESTPEATAEATPHDEELPF
jgi:DNA anti-recombination protein RmuC